MPLAAHIPALSPPASPIAREHGGTHGKAEAPPQVFGEIFREQAGPIPRYAPIATPTVQRDDARNPPRLTDGTEASSPTDEPHIENGEPGIGSAVSPLSLPPAQFQNSSLSVADKANAVILAEASEASIPPPELTTGSNFGSSPSPTQTTTAQHHKSNQPDHAAKQNDPCRDEPEVPLPVLPTVPPITAPIESPFAAQSAAAIEQVPSAPDTGQRINATKAHQQAIDERGFQSGLGTVSKSELAQDRGATPIAQGLQPVTGNEAQAVSQAAGQPSSLKSSGHPATEQTGRATITASAISEAHPTNVESSSSAPRIETQPPSAPPPSTNAAATSTPNPYDKIDQNAAPVVLHSGAQQVAVGVRDPNLGWVEIKTQNIAGHVDATLTAASGQTHASLAAQLGAIAQYLEQRDVRIGTLAVQHQMPQANAGSGQDNGSGSNGAGAQNSSQSNSGNERNASPHTGLSPALPISGLEGADSALRPLSYISVRA